MKLNELRTAVKEAGIRPVDTAHVAEVGALAFRMGITVEATMAAEKIPSLKEIRRRGWERAQNAFLATQKRECTMTNDALLSVHQDDLFTLSQSSGLDSVRLAGIDATAKARREQEYRKRIIALNKKQDGLKEIGL